MPSSNSSADDDGPVDYLSAPLPLEAAIGGQDGLADQGSDSGEDVDYLGLRRRRPRPAAKPKAAQAKAAPKRRSARNHQLVCAMMREAKARVRLRRPVRTLERNIGAHQRGVACFLVSACTLRLQAQIHRLRCLVFLRPRHTGAAGA